MSEKAEKFSRLMQLFGGASGEGGSFAELCKAVTVRNNKEYALAYSKTDYPDRLVLLPQCLRSTKDCKAAEHSAQYICKRCGACKVTAIAEKAEELGYRGVRMLKGGSAIARLLDELKPGAVLGVACGFEGALGMLECERKETPAQFVALVRDGCADTDVELEAVIELLEFRQP